MSELSVKPTRRDFSNNLVTVVIERLFDSAARAAGQRFVKPTRRFSASFLKYLSSHLSIAHANVSTARAGTKYTAKMIITLRITIPICWFGVARGSCTLGALFALEYLVMSEA